MKLYLFLLITLLLSTNMLAQIDNDCDVPQQQQQNQNNRQQQREQREKAIATVVIDSMEYEIKGNKATLIKGKRASIISLSQVVKYYGRNISVTSVGSAAFWGCSSLNSITIPNSVTSIGSEAFDDCSGLTSITIPNTLIKKIPYNVFYSCDKLTSITVRFSDGSTKQMSISDVCRNR